MKRLGALLGLASSCAMIAAAPVPAAPPVGACAPISEAGAAAMQRRTRLAGYYDHKLALIDGRIFEWHGSRRPQLVLEGASHVAVGKLHGYAIDAQQRALVWELGSTRVEPLLDQVALLSAGDSGLLAIRCDGSLWQRRTSAGEWTRSADAAIHAWIGDSADYYIDPRGQVHARGLAHRGQYGDGKLAETPGWTAVAEQGGRVVAHTGHAIYLRLDGAVLGTGGNIYGPLGTHGYGNRAERWGVIFEGATAIATGSRHSLALRPDGSLWIWGSHEGPRPRQAMQRVAEVAAGFEDTLAIDVDGRLWNWAVGKRPVRPVELPATR